MSRWQTRLGSFVSGVHPAFRDTLHDSRIPNADSKESAPCPPVEAVEEAAAPTSEDAPQNALVAQVQEPVVLKPSLSSVPTPAMTLPFLIYPVPEPTVIVDPSTGNTLYPSQCMPTPTLVENVATPLPPAAVNHTSLRTFSAHIHPWTIDAVPPPEQATIQKSLVAKVRIALLLLGVLLYIIFRLCRALLRRAKRVWRRLRRRSHEEQPEANGEPRAAPVLQPMFNPQVHLNHW